MLEGVGGGEPQSLGPMFWGNRETWKLFPLKTLQSHRSIVANGSVINHFWQQIKTTDVRIARDVSLLIH